MILDILEFVLFILVLITLIRVNYKIEKLENKIGEEKRKLLKYKAKIKARPKDDETKAYPEVEV